MGGRLGFQNRRILFLLNNFFLTLDFNWISTWVTSYTRMNIQNMLIIPNCRLHVNFWNFC